MDLTINDCMALAARESATEAELRAAVCVTVGQALHYRYEACGYREAAETARRDAHRARRDAEMTALECVKARDDLWSERDAALAECKAARESLMEARELLRLARDDGEMFARQRDEARSRADLAVQEREDFGLRASAAVARAERAEKAHADAAGVADRLGCRIVDLEADVLCLQGERDRALAEIDGMRVELNSRVNEVNEARRLVRDLAEMTVSRDQLRDEAAMLRQRPTYEARTVAPTEEERRAHEAAGGLWLVITNGGSFHVLKLWRGTLAIAVRPETWIPIGADRLPCAWPVAGEVTP